MKHRVLIVGSGGREHALFDAIAKSPAIHSVVVTPGNGGIPKLNCYHEVKASDFEGLANICRHDGIDLLVVGPEQPLVDGIVDYFAEHAPKTKVFGPSRAAAQLEGSKAFCKQLCQQYGVPTAQAMVCRSMDEVGSALSRWAAPIVIKADGLCAGKGVKVCQTAAEARDFAKGCLSGELFGDAGKKVLVERMLEGRECSLMALADGENVVFLEPARDYKRAWPGEDAPNTGGMGSYSPLPDLAHVEYQAMQESVKSLVRAMASEGAPYRGLLYAGFMLTKDGPMLLEVNCRFGDPETQVVLPRLESDLVPYLLAAAEPGGLAALPPLSWRNGAAVCVVMVSGGYPERYDTGFEIRGLRSATARSFGTVYHAGTAWKDDKLVTAGGRVLGVVGLGRNLDQAQAQAYEIVQGIFWAREDHRSDIGDLEAVEPKKKAAAG